MVIVINKRTGAVMDISHTPPSKQPNIECLARLFSEQFLREKGENKWQAREKEASHDMAV